MIFRVCTMTLPGQALLVDLRPVFRKPLADVTPQLPGRFPKDAPPQASASCRDSFPNPLHTHAKLLTAC